MGLVKPSDSVQLIDDELKRDWVCIKKEATQLSISILVLILFSCYL